MAMRGAKDYRRARDSQRPGLEQRVQFSRGQWRRDERAGAIRSAGWWESVTVTWSPAAAPERHPPLWSRALAAAFDMIAPSMAELAATSARRWLDGRHRRLTAIPSSRRPLPATGGRALPRPEQTP